MTRNRNPRNNFFYSFTKRLIYFLVINIDRTKYRQNQNEPNIPSELQQQQLRRERAK